MPPLFIALSKRIPTTLFHIDTIKKDTLSSSKEEKVSTGFQNKETNYLVSCFFYNTIFFHQSQ